MRALPNIMFSFVCGAILVIPASAQGEKSSSPNTTGMGRDALNKVFHNKRDLKAPSPRQARAICDAAFLLVCVGTIYGLPGVSTGGHDTVAGMANEHLHVGRSGRGIASTVPDYHDGTNCEEPGNHVILDDRKLKSDGDWLGSRDNVPSPGNTGHEEIAEIDLAETLYHEQLHARSSVRAVDPDDPDTDPFEVFDQEFDHALIALEEIEFLKKAIEKAKEALVNALPIKNALCEYGASSIKERNAFFSNHFNNAFEALGGK